MTKYDFSISGLFPNGLVASDRLTEEIRGSAISVALDHIDTAGDVCEVYFKAELSEGEVTILGSMITAHDGTPLVQPSNPIVLTNADGVPLATSIDGRLISKHTVATPGKGTHLRAFNFVTAKKSSLVCTDPLNVPYTDVEYKLFDADGAETQVDAEAVETRIDFEAQYDQELVGGGIITDRTLLGGTSDEWWAAAIAAPHIPAAYGGQVAFVSKINLEMLIDGYLDIDGRSTMFVLYDTTYHSGIIRFNFWHPVGAQKRMLVYLETFK